jgi:hypothetical protein
MEPTEAIDILRGTTSPASVLHPQIAADMGQRRWRLGSGWLSMWMTSC